MDKNPQAWAMAIVLTALSLFLILSGCTKEEQPHWNYYGKQSWVQFHDLENTKQQVFVEKWGTTLEINPPYLLDSLEAFRPTDNENILGKRFIVYSWIDVRYEYTGWGTVGLHNDLCKATLDTTYININLP